MPNKLKLALITLFFLVFTLPASSQLTQLFKDFDENNDVMKISLYSNAEGYIAFKKWIGFTSDGGKTFSRKYINTANVNYNGYAANLTFGFGIKGVKAFDKNNLIVYGDYGSVPSILVSSDRGDTFKLVYQYSSDRFTSIAEMSFPGNGSLGYAVDDHRIFRTTDKGLNWSVVHNASNGYLSHIQTVGNEVFVWGMSVALNTSNGGDSWQTVNLPNTGQHAIQSMYFLTASKAWLSMSTGLYTTIDGGANWTIISSAATGNYTLKELKFNDEKNGYGLGESYNVFKTIDGGKLWEPLPRDNKFSHLGYSHYTTQFWDANTFWVGGGYGFLEGTTNGGGTPLPKAFFTTSTTNLSASNTINLINHSRLDYSYKWYRNGTLFSTDYHASYVRDENTIDEIKLEVTNGSDIGYTTRTINLPLMPKISSFSPTSAATSALVVIEGANFSSATKVTFGSVNASFIVNSSTKITATVGLGATGEVQVQTPGGFTKMAGFTFVPPPNITSFSPLQAVAGDKVIINGINFTKVNDVKFGSTSAASFQVISETQIEAIVGNGASGKISVISAGGIGQKDGFVNIPIISSFYPQKGTEGEVITLRGTGFEGITYLAVGALQVPVKSFMVKSPTEITAIVGAGSTGDIVISKPGASAKKGTFNFHLAPKIESFSPNLVAPGTDVVIVGRNFSNVPAENIVFFGMVGATVKSSTSTSLTVTVPYGASSAPISVTTNNLIAYSSKPLTLFTTDKNVVNESSFKPSLFDLGSRPNVNGAIDIDGDGKIDMISTVLGENSGTNHVLIMLNTSVGDDISFKRDTILISEFYYYLTLSDLNGDGKPDLVLAASNLTDSYKTVAIYINKSAPGTAKFEHVLTLKGADDSKPIIADLDNDGKPDLLVDNMLYRNISSVEKIAFEQGLKMDTFLPCTFAADFDNDGKTDLLFSEQSTDRFEVFRNTSTGIDKISFLDKQSYETKSGRDANVIDIDGDGLQDIAFVDAYNGEADLFRAISTSGSFKFELAKSLSLNDYSFAMNLSDLDGDGKPEVILNSSNKHVSIYKNLSTPGNFDFSDRLDQFVDYDFRAFQVVDLNNDGKPDIIDGDYSIAGYKILLNQTKETPLINSFSPTLGIKGMSISIIGKNFKDITAVKFGDEDAQSFTINSENSITAIVGTGNSGNITVIGKDGINHKSGFTYGIAPTITNVSPMIAPIGSTVTITGIGFSAVPENNAVYFGLAKALVKTASAVSLTVEAPINATHHPITLTVGGLTTSVQSPFINTYPGGKGFDLNTFTPVKTNLDNKRFAIVADLDLDGKLDLATENNVESFLTYVNTSSIGKMMFNDGMPVNRIGGSRYIIADIDGDGKKDLCINSSLKEVHIYKNIGESGTVRFGEKVIVDLGNKTGVFLVDDVDNDGKLDIIFHVDTKIGVLRNIGNANHIKFAKTTYFSTHGSGAWDIILSDIDGDGKKDIVCNSNTTIGILKNYSTLGKPQFKLEKVITPPHSLYAYAFTAADLNGDGKPEIIGAGFQTGPYSLYIYKNKNNGLIDFETSQDIKIQSNVYAISVADLDGDGKPDLVFADGRSYGDGGTTVMQNMGTGNGIAFGPEVQFDLGGESDRNMVADLDGDGKPELIVRKGFSTTLILKNQTGITHPIISSFTPIKATLSQVVTLTGENFVDVESVSFGGVSAKSFVVHSPTSITAVVGEGTSGEVKVVSKVGTGIARGFSYIPQPIINSFSPNYASENVAFYIRGGDFTGATSVKIGNVPVEKFHVSSSSEIYMALGKVASGDIEVTTPIGTAKISGFTFVEPLQITADGPTDILEGSSVLLTANNSNSGLKYQWIKDAKYIPNATGASYRATASGVYSVMIYSAVSLSSNKLTVNTYNNIPPKNFTIKITSTVCRNSSNGSISITPMLKMNYQLSLVHDNTTRTLPFTDQLEINNLAAGTYQLCITNDKDPSFRHCFDVKIEEPKDLFLYANINPADRNVTLLLNGASYYNLNLNGVTYTTDQSSIVLPLKTGNNTIKLSSNLPCQQVLEQQILLPEEIIFYPNPIEDKLNLKLSRFGKTTVLVEITDLLGKLVYRQNHNTVVISSVNLSRLHAGVYTLKIVGEKETMTNKIIKK